MTLVIGNIVSEDPLLQVAEYASDGIEALAKVGMVKPDFIILDLQMPKMNGVEFMKQVRLKSKAKALGVDEVIFKPSGSVSSDLKVKRSQEIHDTIHRILKI